MKTVSNVICLVGPSGVGKTSYIKQLIEKYHFIMPTVVTTRNPRPDDNNDYHYVTKSKFLEMIGNKEFIEWDLYINYYYGTKIKDIFSIIDSGFTVILDLTPKGCSQIINKIPNALIITIFPDNPEWLLERLKIRNCQTLKEIQKRTKILKNYLEQMKSLNCHEVYAYFSPDSWEKTFKEIEKIIKNG